MATTAATAATTYLRCRHVFSPPVGNRSFSFCNNRVKFSIRSSGEVSAETAVETENPIEVQKGPPSLISALNVEKAIRGIAITDVDHYGTLGLTKGCSYDQVTVAYEKKREELMNQGLDEEELGKRLATLKDSYSILSTVEERRLYDWSLARNNKPDTYAWPFEVDLSKASNPTDIPPFQDPEDVEPTRLVGYFMLTWIILAFTLSIALNR